MILRHSDFAYCTVEQITPTLLAIYCRFLDWQRGTASLAQRVCDVTQGDLIWDLDPNGRAIGLEVISKEWNSTVCTRAPSSHLSDELNLESDPIKGFQLSLSDSLLVLRVESSERLPDVTVRFGESMFLTTESAGFILAVNLRPDSKPKTPVAGAKQSSSESGRPKLIDYLTKPMVSQGTPTGDNPRLSGRLHKVSLM